jgi:alpha-amylase/alpha-mannosidase (GH57 family)
MRRILYLALLAAFVSGSGLAGPLNLAIIWHQHQPLYRDELTGEYLLPWVRVHAVQEYIDSPRILAEFPGIHVTYNLQPSLLEQLRDYAEITPEEKAKGGLYQYIGAVDNHLSWIWKLITDPGSLTEEERREMQRQFFWINGYMFDDDANDPYYDPRYATLNSLKNKRPLTDQELLDAAGLYLLWQISPELHSELGIEGLRGKAGFTRDDIICLIQAQHTVITWVIDAYRKAKESGTELITSPFYHPIIPLLCREGMEEDVVGQLELAQAQHTELFGAPAVGVWPPEEAVSDEAVKLLAKAGFSWTVTDQGILAQSLGHTPTVPELTSPWAYGSLAVLFRDPDLSNRIGFSYGNKATELAVADFMGRLRRIAAGLSRPEDHLLVVALDGENWMFMAGYPNNGRSFLRALYKALSQADWVRTLTPAEFLAAHPARRTLTHIATGSWGGDLSTWAGEPEEDEAWTRLRAVRDVVRKAGDPPAALRAVYAAEGSDWFWWYGSDQDSGTDPLFDWLFKTHVIAAYRAVGYSDADIPRALFLKLRAPVLADLGETKLSLDGRITSPEEWAEAASFSGSGSIERVALGYSEKSLYVLVKPEVPAREWIGKPLYLELYVAGKPGSKSNVAPHRASGQLGFAPAWAVELNFAKLKQDGTGYVFRYAADGKDHWRFSSPIASLLFRKTAVDEVVEFEIPFEELGIEPGKTTVLAITLEGDGKILAQVPERPVLARVPALIQGEEIFSLNDPAGDDFGPGTYTYPTNKVFSEKGIFDLVRYSVYDTGDAWQLAFDFAALPNPWNGPQGFSHPLILLFLDVADGGLTELPEEAQAAQVAFDPEHPWDVFVRIAGWPAYGRHLWTADGKGPYFVGVTSDPKRGRIIVNIPKEIVPEIRGWHYVLVASQDGYGNDYVRAIGKTAGEWAGGGCPDPMWAPQIYDYLAPQGMSQEEVLSAYDPAGKHYAIVYPVEVR